MSALADEIERLLKEAFPNVTIKKEYKIVYGKRNLFVDFYIPSYLVAVEVHGKQHDEFTPHFHGDERGWREHKRRDKLKEEWAAVNNVTLVVIRKEDQPRTSTELANLIARKVENE